MYRNRIIPADLKRRFRSSKKVCQAVEGRPSNCTFFVVVVGCIGGGNYGILIVTVYRFRWRARATTWLLVSWYRHRFNYPVNADPATPHQHVVASLLPHVGTTQLGRLPQRYAMSEIE